MKNRGRPRSPSPPAGVRPPPAAATLFPDDPGSWGLGFAAAAQSPSPSQASGFAPQELLSLSDLQLICQKGTLMPALPCRVAEKIK